MGVGSRRWIAFVVGCSFLLAVPSASADKGPEWLEESQRTGAFHLEGGVPVRLAGEASVSSWEGAVHAVGMEGDLQWRIQADGLSVRVVELWEERPWGMALGPVFSGSRVSETRLKDAVLDVNQRLDGFEVFSWTETGQATLGVAGDGRGSGADADWRVEPDMTLTRSSSSLFVQSPGPPRGAEGSVLDSMDGFTHEVDAGWFEATAPVGEFTLRGPLQGYLFGAHVFMDSREGREAFRLSHNVEEREGGVFVPGTGWMGPGNHESRVIRFLEFEAEDAVIKVWDSGAGAALLGPSLSLDLEGHLAVPRSEGRLSYKEDDTERAIVAQGETAVVSGTVLASFNAADSMDRVVVEGSGHWSYVAAGVQEAWPLGTIASVAGAVVTIAAVWTFVQWLSPWPLMPLFSRLESSNILSHPLRRRIYSRVHEAPGVSPQVLARELSAGWSTVVYHLRVLERSGFVCGVRDGRHRRFFDAVSGRWANGRKQVLAVLLNPTTARVAKIVLDEPGVAQRDIASRLDLAPSSINWHVARLDGVDLVRRQRVKGKIRLSPGRAWDDLEPAGAKRILTQVVGRSPCEPEVDRSDGSPCHADDAESPSGDPSMSNGHNGHKVQGDGLYPSGAQSS